MKTVSYIINNRSWKSLVPYLALIETGGRTRVELRKVTDGRSKRQIDSFMAPCPVCGKMNKVIRYGDHGRGYLAVSCPTDVNYRCQRSRKCSVALQAIAAEIKRLRKEAKGAAEKQALEKGGIIVLEDAKKKARA